MIGPFCGLLSLLVAGRYVEVILQLIEKAGDFVSDDIWYRVVQFVTNNDDLQVLTCGPSFLDVHGNMENGLKIWYCIHHNVYTTLDHYHSESYLLYHMCLSCAFKKHAPTSTYLVPDLACSESGLSCRVWQLRFFVEDRHLLQQRLGSTLTSQQCMKPWWRWWSFWIRQSYVSWVLTNVMTESLHCFWKCDRNSECKCLCNGLPCPKIWSGLLYTYLHPLLGLDKVSGES